MNPEDYPNPSVAMTSHATHPWQPKELKPIHLKIIEMHVHQIPVARIARNCRSWGHNVTATHIRRIIATRKGMEYASAYSAKVHGGMDGLVQHVSDYAPAALLTELNIMRDPLAEPRHRLNAAQDVMDRAGPPKISRQENENRPPTIIMVNVSPSQMSQFLQAPPVIEAQVVELLPSTTTEAE